MQCCFFVFYKESAKLHPAVLNYFTLLDNFRWTSLIDKLRPLITYNQRTMLNQSYHQQFELSLYFCGSIMSYCMGGLYPTCSEYTNRTPGSRDYFWKWDQSFNLHLKCFFFIDYYVYGNMVSWQCQGSPSHAHVCEFIWTQFIPKLCYIVHKLAQEWCRETLFEV